MTPEQINHRAKVAEGKRPPGARVQESQAAGACPEQNLNVCGYCNSTPCQCCKGGEHFFGGAGVCVRCGTRDDLPRVSPFRPKLDARK